MIENRVVTRNRLCIAHSVDKFALNLPTPRPANVGRRNSIYYVGKRVMRAQNVHRATTNAVRFTRRIVCVHRVSAECVVHFPGHKVNARAHITHTHIHTHRTQHHNTTLHLHIARRVNILGIVGIDICNGFVGAAVFVSTICWRTSDNKKVVQSA